MYASPRPHPTTWRSAPAQSAPLPGPLDYYTHHFTPFYLTTPDSYLVLIVALHSPTLPHRFVDHAPAQPPPVRAHDPSTTPQTTTHITEPHSLPHAPVSLGLFSAASQQQPTNLQPTFSSFFCTMKERIAPPPPDFAGLDPARACVCVQKRCKALCSHTRECIADGSCKKKKQKQMSSFCQVFTGTDY